MNRIRRNIVANTLGRGWSTLLGVAILPLYIRLLGAEAYGLVAVYGTIAVFCSLCDTGISTSLGRELARSRGEGQDGKDVAEIVRTAEIIYVGIGLLLGALITLSAPLIVTNWIHLKEMSPAVAIRAVRLMGLFFVFQWPMGLYLAGLSGLQRQVELNIVSSFGSSLRTVGSVVVLWTTSATITTFYTWQVIAAAISVVAAREALWRAKEVRRRDAAFRWSVLQRVRRFAGGVTLLSLLSVLVSELDTIVLLRFVSLQSFGYYSFATSVAGAATFFSAPVLAATYPPMIEANSARDDQRLHALFHRGAQLVSVAVFAPAAVLFVFSPVVLHLWARDATTTAQTSTLVSACLIGASLNGAAVMPYNLTLAAGRVRPAMIAAATSLVIYMGALGALAPHFGVMAGAAGYALVNIVSLFIYARFAVNLLLPGEGWRWLFVDLLVPLVTAGVVATLIRALASPRTTEPVQFAGLLLASMATLVCTALATRTCRDELTFRAKTAFARWGY